MIEEAWKAPKTRVCPAAACSSGFGFKALALRLSVVTAPIALIYVVFIGRHELDRCARGRVSKP